MVKHNYSRYSNRYCDCEICKKAWADYQQSLRAKREARLRENPTAVEHGKYTTYDNWRCRCTPCKQAHNAEILRRRKAKAEK